MFARLMVPGNEAKHVTSYRFLNLFHYRYLTFSSCEFYGSLQLGLLLFGLVVETCAPKLVCRPEVVKLKPLPL